MVASWLRRHPVIVMVVVHVVVFALLAWMADAFSLAYPELSPGGSSMRLVPLDVR